MIRWQSAGTFCQTASFWADHMQYGDCPPDLPPSQWPLSTLAYLSELQRDWAREATVPAVLQIFEQHGGTFGSALRWEWDLLGLIIYQGALAHRDWVGNHKHTREASIKPGVSLWSGTVQ